MPTAHGDKINKKLIGGNKMLKTEIGFGSVKFNQGNDDVSAMMSCSHVRSETELTELAGVFAYGSEFGQEMLSQIKFEETVPTVVEFATVELAQDKGRLELELVFENGKKHKLSISNYLNDPDLITAMKNSILGKSAGAFGVTTVVSAVNTTFIKNKY